MVGYQAQSSINAGTNALTKYINLLQEDGTSVFNTIRCADGLRVGSTFGAGEGTIPGVALKTHGNIELSGPTPCIDFHYNNSSSDYTSRIIDDGSYLSIYGDLRAVNNTFLNGGTWAGNVFLPSTSNEYVGFYSDRSTRYCWIGRNGSSNTKFYFTAEDNVDGFYFNKPITHPGMSYSTSEKWTGKYDPSGRKIYCMYLGEYDATNKTGNITAFTKTFGAEIQDVWFDMQMSNICQGRTDGTFEYKPISSPSSDSTCVIESICWLQSDRKTLKIRNIFGSSFNQYPHKYIHPYILYTYK